MATWLSLTAVGVVSGCIYALTAAGLVVTYTTSGVFNFAHGAVGMMGAFTYWELYISWGLPNWLALIIVVFVMAPIFGALIERLLIRPLKVSSLDTTLTITVGLLLFLIALATMIWDPRTARTLPQFGTGHTVKVVDVVLTYHQLGVVGAAIVVAIALRIFLRGTRAGIASRAVVDDRELLALTGAPPARYGQLGWALGSSLAALAGILLAPLVRLDIQTLTLLVINGYAAAMLGRLRNLPLTFVGGLILGLAESYAVGYLPVGDLLSQIKPVVPMVFLFITLLVLPQSRLSLGRAAALRPPRVAGFKESIIVSVVFLVAAYFASGQLSETNLSIAGRGVALGLIMLSLVLLTGYGGQVSLCQLTFAGVGAWTMGKVGGDSGSWWGLIAAVALSAAVGALIALPALRLRGLYLALSTLAFAYVMDYMFFQNIHVFGISASQEVARLNLGGIDVSNNRTFFMVLCVVFALVGIFVLALRRSTFGRRLVAMGDSPAACATVGLSLRTMKLAVFSLSAGLAGLGGALYGGQQHRVGPDDFALLASLSLLLLAVIFGVRTITGMLVGGIMLVLFPVIQTHLDIDWLRNITYLLVGLGAIGIGRNPNGSFGGNTPLQQRRERKAAALLNVPQQVTAGAAADATSSAAKGPVHVEH